MAFYQQLNVPPPFAAMLTLISVGEYEFATGGGSSAYYASRVDRKDLLLPEVLVQDFTASPADQVTVMSVANYSHDFLV